MKTKVFLDTNILLDLLVAGRDSEASLKIFRAVRNHEIEAQVTTQSLMDAAYCANRCGVTFDSFKSLIQDLIRYVNIDHINFFHILWAMDNHSGDFEDDAQVSCAIDGACDFFVTHDKEQLGRTLPEPMVFISPEDFAAGTTGSGQ